MKVELGFVLMAFLGGMATQDQIAGDKIEWVDYGENPMSNPEFMKDWMAAGALSEEHKRMAQFDGKWDVAGKMWMGVDGEPMATVGTCENRLILGGRYLIEEYKSEFMGMPYEGMLLQGYSNLRKQHFDLWIDSMSTEPSISWGKRDGDDKVQSSGMMYDVMTPKGRPTRTTQTPTSDGGGMLEMFDTLPTGEDLKVMELIYTRPKGDE